MIYTDTWFEDPSTRFARKHGAVPKDLQDLFVLFQEHSEDNITDEHISLCVSIAQEGDGFARWLCGEIFSMDGGEYHNINEAIKWSSGSAEAKYPPGYFQFGLFYEEGVGCEKNVSKAIQNYQKSMETGFGFAAAYLADKYQEGELGLASDPDKAIKLAKLAYQLGEYTASEFLYDSLRNSELPDAEQQTLYWTKESSKNGYPMASLRLSHAYQIGRMGVKVDSKKAKYYGDLSKIQTEKIDSLIV